MKTKILFTLLISGSLLLSCQRQQQTVEQSPSSKTEEAKPQEVVKQQGQASWYGPDFHGKTTANGETFNQNELTAASKTLPLGSTAKVTNTDTGKSVTVRINDRGPYVGDRVMDLSKAAAEKIDIKDQGVSHVKIVAKKPAKKTKNKSKKTKRQ